MNFWKSLNSKKTLTIDLGSRYIRACIFDENKTPKKYIYDSAGIEYGLIVDENKFKEVIELLLSDINRDIQSIPKNVLITINSSEQNSASLSVVTYTKRADGIITDLDIMNIKDNARKKIEHLKDKIILHDIIIKNKIDGNMILGDIRKTKGYKIESKVLFIYEDSRNYSIIQKTFGSLGVKIDKVLSGSVVEAEMLLSEKEKRLGTATLNIGHHITTLCVYERGLPILNLSIPYGGELITSEIALSLRLDLDEAEEAKINMNLKDYSRRRVEEIVENSVFKLSETINDNLDRVKRKGLLPGGLRILGGSSHLNRIENYLKYDLSLPSVNINYDNR
ncbi:MAG: cell division protein FtsA, partial [Patescibacteria group bacterium]|nr:cell division protein FtsA [Patescibacteria group bacterium]